MIAKTIGVPEVMQALQAMSLAEIKQVVKAAREAETEHRHRDSVKRCEALLPICKGVMEELVPEVEGDLFRKSKKKAWVVPRRLLKYYLKTIGFAPVVIAKAFGEYPNKIAKDLDEVSFIVSHPAAFGMENDLLNRFASRMSQELEQRKIL